MAGIEKIYFAYPTLLKEGMPAGQGYIPDPLIAGIYRGSIQTIVVTAGIMLSQERSSFTSIDILLNGDVVTPDSNEIDGFYEQLKMMILDNKQTVILSAMHVKYVIFEQSGIYEVRLKIFELSALGEKTDNLIDCYSSYFQVLIKEDD